MVSLVRRSMGSRINARHVMMGAFFVACLLVAPAALGQNARLQIVHNLSDPALPVVDVFVNGLRVSNNLAYRQSTTFIEVPSGPAIDVGIAPDVAGSAADTLKNVRLALDPNRNYVAVLSGVTSAGFVPNPDGRDTGMRLIVMSGAKRGASNPTTVDLVFMHGITDAPGIDLRELGFGSLPIFPGLRYGDISSYVTINPVNFGVVLTQTTLQAAILQAFDLQLATRAGRSGVLVGSGFVRPETNCASAGCPGVALLAVFDNGETVSVPILTDSPFLSKIQFIQASGDPDLRPAVDLYLNGQRWFDDLPFNSALPYLNVFAGEPLDIGIARGTSLSAADTLQNFRLRLTEADNYTVALIGMLSPTRFAANPDGRDTSLQLLVRGGGRTALAVSSRAEYRFLNAVTDAPAVDLLIRGGEVLKNEVRYGEVSEFRTIEALNYKIDITPTNAPAYVLASYPINFRNFGKPVTFILTGYSDRFLNRNGFPIQLKAVYSDGFVAEWSPETISDQTARVQFIHGSPDPDLGVVDLYVQNERIHDDMRFLDGKGYATFMADTPVEIGIGTSSSTGPEDTFKRIPVVFERGKRYTAVLAGVRDPELFKANPNGEDIGLNLLIRDGAREADPAGSATTEVRVVYAVPDGPKADIYIDNVAVLADTAAYGTITDYVSLDAQGSSWPGDTGYYLNFQPRGDLIFGRSIMNLNSVGRRAVTVVSTGFNDPFANQGGSSFRSVLVFRDGFEPDVIQNSLTDAESDVPGSASTFRVNGNFPNPFSTVTRLELDLPESALLGIDVFDVAGRLVARQAPRAVSAGNGVNLEVDASALSPGAYVYRLTAESATHTWTGHGRFLVVR